jgi:hypothetical protein
MFFLVAEKLQTEDALSGFRGARRWMPFLVSEELQTIKAILRL